jgi:membrane protease YdiL (CAAX protease family)
LQVGYSTDIATMFIVTFFFGLMWGALIYYTRSLIASILFHAGADLVLIVPIFDSFGSI